MRFFWPLVALAACHSDASATSDEAALTDGETFAQLHPVLSCDGVDLVSDLAVNEAEGQTACAALTSAYRFDLKLAGVEGTKPALDRRIVFGLASPALKKTGGASAFGLDDMLARFDQFIPEPKPGVSAYVLAHELTHLTMNRLGSPVGRMPIYLFEGIATSQGLWFIRQRGEVSGWPMETMTAHLSAVTSAQARDLLSTFRTYDDYCRPVIPLPEGCTERACRCQRTAEDVGLGEQVGSLFVEYLRAHVEPDTHHRLGRVWGRIAGGMTVEAGILAEYGRSLADLEADFVTFLATTEAAPAERLAGTVFALP